MEITNKDIDRVGNIEQKESALDKAGLKRLDVYRRIKEMLDAVDVEENIKDGMLIKTEVPNMAMRAKGVELALKAFGDLKEFDKGGSVTNNFTFASMVKVAMTQVLPPQTHNNVVEVPVLPEGSILSRDGLFLPDNNDAN